MNNSAPIKKSQIEIKSANLDADKLVVEKILLVALNEFILYDNTDTSRVPDTIKSIVEAKGFGFGLGARVVKNSIFVDFNRGQNQSSKFDEVHNFILKELQNVFRRDLQEIWEDNSAYCATKNN
jgi:hypothetical protein